MEFRDLKKQYLKYENEFDQAVKKIMLETHFISGNQVKQLEERMAKYVGVKHCITCGNGTDALSLVLEAWGIGQGDAVFVPNYTFFATAEVVSYVGATPIFVDVYPDTFNIDIEHLEKQIKNVIQEGILKPKVIIPVDLFGLLANYEKLDKVAKKYNLLVLEDAAQAFGAEYKGRKACSFGDAATTSFFPAKPLGCYGDGGAVFTNDDNLASLLESLKVHGKNKEDKYDNIRIGVNSRLDTIQAAILDVKLDAFIKHELSDVNKVYELYTQRLKDYVVTPVIPEGYYSSFAQYTIKLSSRSERDGLQNFLKENDVPSLIYYTKTMHQQKAFSYLSNSDTDYPVSTKLCDLVLSIPIHPYITIEEIDKVSGLIKTFVQMN